MERRYEVPKREIEEDAKLDARALAGVIARLVLIWPLIL